MDKTSCLPVYRQTSSSIKAPQIWIKGWFQCAHWGERKSVEETYISDHVNAWDNLARTSNMSCLRADTEPADREQSEELYQARVGTVPACKTRKFCFDSRCLHKPAICFALLRKDSFYFLSFFFIIKTKQDRFIRGKWTVQGQNGVVL